MEIIGCTPGTMSIEEVTVNPIGDGFAEVKFVVQATVHIHFELPDNIMIMGLPFIFTEKVVLCVPDDRIFFSIHGTINCSAILIDEETIMVQVHICKVFNAVTFVDLLIPSYGFCTPQECKNSDTCINFLVKWDESDKKSKLSSNDKEDIKLQQPDRIECIHTLKVYDSCWTNINLEGQRIFPIIPPDPPISPCPLPNARTRGFWGTSRGGIRMLIAMGTVSFETFVDDILVPIVGPGGRSPFLNNFFDPGLFTPTLNREGIYARYITLFTQPVMGMIIRQLVAQLFTTYLNVVATDERLLPPNQVCVDEDTTFATQEITNIDLVNCTFNVVNEPQLIVDILNNIETILAACCPGGDQPCNLTNTQISRLINVLDNINNNLIFVFHELS